jgi:hypothetical protein
MTFLPIVDRELRVASRRRGTYWLRTLVGLGIIAACAWVFLASLGQTPHEVGQRMFYVLTGGALLYCLLVGTRTTADCLSEEKREGTLGLLFLTDLKGYDVVSGKLVANSMNAAYGLLAAVPVLAIPLLMGGVTPGEFARMSAVLVDALFLSLSIGMFASAISRSWRHSMALTFLLVLILTAGFPALGGWVGHRWHFGNPEFGYFLPSAGYAYAMGLDFFYKSRPAEFYWSLGTIHLLGWVFFGLAALIAPRTWQDRPAGARALRWRGFLEQWGYGDTAERRRFRGRLLEKNAFFWLAARARLKPAGVWGSLGALTCGWVWGAFKLQGDWFNEGIYIATAIVLNSLLKSWLGLEAGRQLSEDRKIGALELLLSTPLTVREILRGQRLALQRQFLGPLAAVLLVDLVMLLAGSNRNGVMGGNQALWFSLWIAGMVMLLADLVTLYWMGMWMGLAAKTPRHASGNTIVRVLVLPWILFLVFLTFAAVTESQFQAQWSWETFLGVWFALGLLVDIGFGLWARHCLLTRFREVATQRFQTRAPFWRRTAAGIRAARHWTPA